MDFLYGREMAIVEQNTFPQIPVPNQNCLNSYWHFHLNVALGARSWSRLTGMLFPFQLGLSCETINFQVLLRMLQHGFWRERANINL